ncbi:MAG: cache domain-containing protein [Desulfobulbaceae bacterium]|nr:cache domain-containing protein [Desulfobulbaceae bacterium]
MTKNKSIIKIFLVSAILLFAASIIITGFISVSTDYSDFLRDSKRIEKNYIEQQKFLIKNEVQKALDFIGYKKSQLEERVQEQIQNRVYEAHSIATNIYKTNKDTQSLTEIEDLVREALRPIRFLNGRGYFFAVSLDGREQLFADHPEIEGQNMLQTQDTQGKFVIRDMINIVRRDGEGFYQYTWTKPDFKQRHFPKIAFVKYFEPLNWLIGTGEYLDDMERDIQREVLDRIAKIRFGRDGYIFVVDFQGTTLMNDTQRNLIGKNLWELTDPNGIKVIQEERKAAENPEGDFINYVWNKPTKSKPVPKISFIKAFRDWEWMVGAGVYLDDIENIISNEKNILQQKVTQHIIASFTIMVVAVLLMILFTRYLSGKIEKEFDIFTAFFEKASWRSASIDIEHLNFSEFKRLAIHANRMVAKRKEADEKRLQAESEKDKLKQQLLQAQKLEAIGTLAGGIAHDFNNILSIIIGYADMAKEDAQPDPAITKDLEEILTASNRAKDLVQQILLFSRQSQVERININPQSVLREALKMLRPSIPTTIEIQENIATDCGCIEADPTQLYQIVINICTNAFHAMEKNGGVLKLELKTAETIPEELKNKPGVDTDFIEISISDTGHGIKPDIIDKIFNPFFTTKEQGKGTGMGLAIAYGIIRDYGGTISVESRIDIGTVFHIYLPKKQSEAAPAPLPSKKISGGTERILFVDDEQLLVEMGKLMLEKLGYQVTIKMSSHEALHTFRENPENFDLVITDQTMPGMTGLELSERMLHIRSTIPIILCTGYSTLVDEKKAKEKGIKEFALKPLSKENIALLIRKVLDGIDDTDE